MNDRYVALNETGEWLLYRAMVCEALDQNPDIKDALDVDPWEFTSALDMSFDETRPLPLHKWQDKIRDDLQEMSDDWHFWHGQIRVQ
jgi:hypothetical protein